MKMHRLSEVAEQLACSLSNVYVLVESGELVVTSTGAGGKGYRVSEESLAAFIESRKKGRKPVQLDPRRNPRPQPFSNLDAGALQRAWRRQGVVSDQPNEGNVRSSE